AVVVNHLVDREPLLQQFAPVARRRQSHLGQRRSIPAGGTRNLAASQGLERLLDPQRLDELLEKVRYAVLELVVGGLGRAPLRDLQSAAVDQVSPVGGEKFVKHARQHTLVGHRLMCAATRSKPPMTAIAQSA